MWRDEKALERIYERDKESGAFIINAVIERYVDIFNELDPAPFRRRDLDHDLRLFLEDCSSDIPLKFDVILQLDVSRDLQDVEKEERIKLGLKTYFSFVKNSLGREIRESYRKSGVYVLASFSLLFLSYSLRSAAMGSLVYNTLIDGINIGGWVFLWEAISTFAFKNRGKKERFRHYKRFMYALIRFNYLQRNKST